MKGLLAFALVDESVAVLMKPRGVTTEDCLEAAATQLGCRTLFSVHRLDGVASGLLVAARSAKAASSLSEAWGDATKEYLALCEDVPPRQEGFVQAKLGKRLVANKFERMSVCKDGLEAATRYRVVSHCKTHSLVHATLLTGRKHQIRAHMAHIGCPLVGDYKFGARQSRGGVFLHAVRLAFMHPTSGERVDLTMPLPVYFASALTTLGLKQS